MNRLNLLLLILLPVAYANVTCNKLQTIYAESSCCGNASGDAQCLQEIPACGGCSDGSLKTETECLDQDVTTGTPLATTDANYLDQTACYQYFHATYPSPVAFTVTGLTGNGVDPHGCFRKTIDSSSHGYFNVDTGGSGACTASKPCIQNTDKTWSGSTQVEAGQVCVANNKIFVKGLLDAFDFSNTNHITLKKSIIPDTNDAYDLGNAEYKIRDIYEQD